VNKKSLLSLDLKTDRVAVCGSDFQTDGAEKLESMPNLGSAESNKEHLLEI